jgi:two-component system phosphate regulon sensor histidine kinase PhoR
MGAIFHQIVETSAVSTLPVLGREALLSGVAAILVAFPLAAWFSLSISRRLRRMIKFAHRIAEGDLDARLNDPYHDEISTMTEPGAEFCRTRESPPRTGCAA